LKKSGRYHPAILGCREEDGKGNRNGTPAPEVRTGFARGRTLS
jgi:hypothetical protein